MEELRNLFLEKKGVFVCSTGGHLEQAIRRAHQLNIQQRVVFLTFRNAQSKSRLSEYDYAFLKTMGSRDFLGVIKNVFSIYSYTKKFKSKYIISTGAGIALSCILVSFLRRIPFIYIESVARQNSPSMTGKILERFFWVKRYTESDNFSNGHWGKIETIFSNYAIIGERIDINEGGLKIFVTLGTHDQFEFPRIIQMVLGVIRPDDRVFWQINGTTGVVVPGEIRNQVSSEEFRNLVENSDVVITHAGVGSLLTILSAGKFPIVVPRQAKFREHIDDHQFEIAEKIERLGLGFCAVTKVERVDLYAASRKLIG